MSLRATAPDYTALVAARICHDLINPIGAIGNGLEFFSADGEGLEPDIYALLSKSTAIARWRLQVLRLAFGPVHKGRGRKVNGVLEPAREYGEHLGIELDWRLAREILESEAKALVLGLLVAQTCLARGGSYTAFPVEQGYNIEIKGQGARFDPALWAQIEGSYTAEVTAAGVHFPILGQLLAESEITSETEFEGDRASLRWRY